MFAQAADGHFWVHASREGSLTITNLKNQEQELTTVLDGMVECATVAPNDNVILIGDTTGNIYCFKYTTYEEGGV